jgi:3-hydroxybutyryl-CoA dehydratase
VVTVTGKRDDKRIITLKTTVSNQHGEVVIDGNAVVKKVGL